MGDGWRDDSELGAVPGSPEDAGGSRGGESVMGRTWPEIWTIDESNGLEESGGGSADSEAGGNGGGILSDGQEVVRVKSREEEVRIPKPEVMEVAYCRMGRK
eukprot:s4675_g1.t1